MGLPVVISQARIVDEVRHRLVRCIEAGLGAAAAYQVLLNLQYHMRMSKTLSHMLV
jgi:hypothetical protein